MDNPAILTDDLLALARSPTPADRERLLMAVADLCDGGDSLSSDAKDLVQDIFMGLVAQAERDIRQRLSEKLAQAAWAPRALISILALDDIEIARPVIAGSPVLQDADLIHLLIEATLEHQIEVARRPGIGAPVVTAIIDQNQPAVMTALADNTTAQVTARHMRQLVIASRRTAGLRGPLARHPQLTDNLAHALYGLVGDALQGDILKRFTIDPGKLQQSLSEAVSEAMAGDVQAADAEHEREELERRLIAKLQAADQLRPGYLLRALREGRSSLFVQALAALGGFETAQIAQAISANRPDLLALACAAVGIDRSVFPTILSLVQTLNHGRPQASGAMDRIFAAFSVNGQEAARAFRAAAEGI